MYEVISYYELLKIKQAKKYHKLKVAFWIIFLIGIIYLTGFGNKI